MGVFDDLEIPLLAMLFYLWCKVFEDGFTLVLHVNH